MLSRTLFRIEDEREKVGGNDQAKVRSNLFTVSSIGKNCKCSSVKRLAGPQGEVTFNLRLSNLGAGDGCELLTNLGVVRMVWKAMKVSFRTLFKLLKVLSQGVRTVTLQHLDVVLIERDTSAELCPLESLQNQEEERLRKVTVELNVGVVDVAVGEQVA